MQENLNGAWETVKRSRSMDRPCAADYIEKLCDGFIELHGDRLHSDDRAIIGGIAMLFDLPITVIAQQKGHSLEERKWRNYGMPHPEGYRKALRLIKNAEKFNRCVLCIVDTPGAYCGVEAEERGQSLAIAQNLLELSKTGVPIITLVIGEGGSGGALALSVCDKLYMMQNSIYSVISPEGCASILFKDATKAPLAAKSLKLTAYDLHSLNLIDEIIPEPEGYSYQNMDGVLIGLKRKLYVNFKILSKNSSKKLAQNRQARYLNIGRKKYDEM